MTKLLIVVAMLMAFGSAAVQAADHHDGGQFSKVKSKKKK